MSVNVALKELSIVLVGAINTKILHPSWFARHGMIKTAEADESDVEVVHRDISSWSIEWVKLHATNERMQFSTEQEAFFEPVRDLAQATLTVLEHMPVTKLGMNLGYYYQFPNRDSYDAFGHSVAPKDRWVGALSDPRTLRVAVTSRRTDNRKGYINSTVMPHDRFPLCAYLNINDHFEIQATDSPASEAIEILTECWEAARSRPDDLAKTLFSGF
jgi:hypothetical protein